MDSKKLRLSPATGPFQHRHGGPTARAVIPWTGDWDTFVARAALIDLDVTGFAVGPNKTLIIPAHLRGESQFCSLAQDGWLGYVEGSEIIQTWAGEFFRYEYFGGPKPAFIEQQQRMAEGRPPHPLRQSEYRPPLDGSDTLEKLTALGASPRFKSWLRGEGAQ